MFLGKEKGRLVVQYTTIILCTRQAGITVIWSIILIIKGSGLSRRVVRNRGSIDFWEGGGKESIELELISKINHRGRRQLRPGGNPGT
jgi:hypothetical protein